MPASEKRFLFVMCDPVAPSGLLGQTILAKGGFYDTIVPAECFASWSPRRYPGVPDSPLAYSGLAILGGRMSVHDEADYPHFAELGRLAKAFEATGKPVLGICLGAQIIARAYGARVWRMDELESGFVALDVTVAGRDDPLFRGLDRRLTLFQSHYEAFDLPAGAANLVTGGTCDCQAFRVGDVTYGFQFHVEVTIDMVREWLRLFGDRLFRDEPRLLTELDGAFRRHMESQHQLAARIFGRWMELAPSAD